jgi:hypothetical protein
VYWKAKLHIHTGFWDFSLHHPVLNDSYRGISLTGKDYWSVKLTTYLRLRIEAENASSFTATRWYLHDMVLSIVMLKLKVKVKLSLCLINHHAMKTYWVSGGIASRILNLGIRWREWLASYPGRFIPGEINPGIHWIGVLESPGVSLDAVTRRRNPSRFREWNPGRPAHRA